MGLKIRRIGRRLSSAFQIWNTRNLRYYEASARRTRGEGTSMPLMSSSPGIVQSHDWHSTKPLFCVIEFYLEERGLAPGTINVRLAAMRRLAYEAADAGLLSPELAAGMNRAKGVRKLGSRLGNWLPAEEASALWQSPDGQTLIGKRNRAILAILLGCGLRRRELAELALERLQRREDRWTIVDLIGKGMHIRTVPVPNWVKATLDTW
jgi:site-specific recombinase XerC